MASMLRCTVCLLLLGSVTPLNVAVFGATGRIGALTVQRLVAGGHSVTAVVRSTEKAAELLPAGIETRVLDVGEASGDEIRAVCAGADSAIWCASGFTAAGDSVDVAGVAAAPTQHCHRCHAHLQARRTQHCLLPSSKSPALPLPPLPRSNLS